ncbi:MAG: adenylate/guanylate cyclase domain-containing protein [Methylococcales bacterium]|nr:MAG: adenylate/guanylate cyclase domain-containing protein [Methylococcales bacterium]
MRAEYSYYDYEKSRDRIDDILKGADASYEDKKSIPPRDSLTFDNGFYVSCSALFIDIRGSKVLSTIHTKPVQAKIYKSYISELVAILRSNNKIHEIYIEGDCVWGIFNTPEKPDIDQVFSTASSASSLIDTLNIKYKKRGYSELTVGIGLAYGESLCIKAGHKGSGINEVVWLGKLVGEAAQLCSYGNKTYSDARTMVSEFFYNNLNDYNKNLLTFKFNRSCYHGNVINKNMDEWVKSNG